MCRFDFGSIDYTTEIENLLPFFINFFPDFEYLAIVEGDTSTYVAAALRE